MSKQQAFWSILTVSVIMAISGCSIAAYTPVVVSSSFGLSQTDLSSEPEYKDYIGIPLKLHSVDNKAWYLKKFKKGRYYIELSNNSENSVCELSQGYVYINKVFFDSINDGLFYQAVVNCHSKSYQAPLNRWTDKIVEPSYN